MIPSSTHFILAIDQDRDLLLNHLVQLAMGNPDYAARLDRNGMTKVAEDLFMDLAKGSTKVGWCNVTDCKGGNCEHKKETKEAIKQPKNLEPLVERVNKIKTYSIVVDEPLDYIFNVVFRHAEKNKSFIEFLEKKGFTQRYLDFSNEWDIKCHKAGLCVDPDCNYDSDNPNLRYSL